MEDLSVIVRHCRNFAEKGLKEYDLSFGEQMILIHLTNSGFVNQDTISKRYMIDKSMVAKTLNKLEDKGCILRKQNPENKRENIISLTEKGSSITNNIMVTFKKWNEILFDGISLEDMAYVRDISKKMIMNISEYMEHN